MKNIISFLVAFAVVVALVIGVVYFVFSKQNFLPWDQLHQEEYLQEPLVIDSSSFEDGSLVVTETDVAYQSLAEVVNEENREKVVVIANYFNDIQKPRFMTLSPYGDIVVSDIKTNEVYAIIDEDGDFKGDTKITIISNLNNPHGVLFHNGDLYIAETDKVRVLRGVDSQYRYNGNDVLISGLSDVSGHFTRTIQIIDNKLYVSIGSSCNACIERDDNRASILRYDLNGTNREVYASGLRNTVGFIQSPFDGQLYGLDNGRDWLGDRLPPEELNIIQKGHYGWPYCYGDKVRDDSIEGSFDCESTQPPLWLLPAHVAPFGLRFYQGEMFSEFNGDLLIAQHGSWNATSPVGYKVSRLDFDEQNKPTEAFDFLDVFLSGDTVKGRPVDILIGTKGEVYVTDDFAGRIYVMYKQ